MNVGNTLSLARKKAAEKAMDYAKTQEFHEIAIALEKVSKNLAEKITTKELVRYIEAIRAEEESD